MADAVVQELLKRVAALEDIAAITALKIRYWRSLDQRRFTDVEACFTADAVIDMEGIPRCENRAAFMKIVTSQGAKPGVYNMHHGHHPSIKITGADTAEGTWESYFHGIDAGARTIIQLSGEYHDAYAREAGRWLIKAMRFRQTSFLMEKIDAAGAPTVVSLGTPDPKAFA
jgi:hypothetical protein